MRANLTLFVSLLSTSCGQWQAKTKDVNPAPIVTEQSARPLPKIPKGIQADRIFVDKSDRTLTLFKGDTEIARYTNIRLGNAPLGHKQFEGDEKTPEGVYTIDGRNPASNYYLSLRISYPNAADTAYAKAQRKSAGGDIFIHGQPNRWKGHPIARDWTDGCIALSNEEIKQLWDVVPDGSKITIQQ
jgi:murein L,D-transpeptidase YafK